MKPEDIKNKKIAVLCDTLDKANKLFEIFENRKADFRENFVFDMLTPNLCQNIGQFGTACGRKDVYEESGYKIITFEQFVQEPQEEPISTEEILEVLVNEYTSGKYDEIFGCNPCFETLTSEFTPAEIVQKITEWKRKQKQIQVTEDMIADALDEKYGVGNWGRE